MAYCRFSTDDFSSDAYCYEGGSGFITYVAGRRVVYKEPLPPVLPFDSEHVVEWFERHNNVMRMFEEAEKVDIGLPYDGECFCDPDAKSAMERLLILREAGYNIPQSAIDGLRDDTFNTNTGGVS